MSLMRYKPMLFGRGRPMMAFQWTGAKTCTRVNRELPIEADLRLPALR
jgi:hypothetical protein